MNLQNRVGPFKAASKEGPLADVEDTVALTPDASPLS